MKKGSFPAQTRRLLELAWAITARAGHSRVGTEHILVAAAASTDTLPGRLLHWRGLSADELLAALLAECGRGTALHRLPQGFSTRAQRALRRAAAQSQALCPAALLLCILRDSSCGACRLLTRCGAAPELLFSDLYEGQCVRKEQAMQNFRLLEQFAVDMVARPEKTDLVIGRNMEIETVLQILSRRQKNNPALIGEPGVGKTAIVEGVAQRIAAGQVPEALRGKHLYALDMASVIAGTKYRGEFEERIRDLLAELRRTQNVILFVDEMHTLVGAGAAEGAIDAANLFKPALGRGELQLIGATTLSEYRKYIEKDAALERRFRTVQVRESTPEETRCILESLRPALEAHHHIPIAPEAISAAVELSCRYLTDKFLPDKAVDLLDEGAARANLGRFCGCSPDAQEAQHDLREAVRSAQYEKAAALRDRLQRLRRQPQPQRRVCAEDIAAVVSSRTGIPLGMLSASERQRLSTLEQTLGRSIIGQEGAIHAVVQAVHRGRSGLAGETRPVAAMLFIGPTGVGKTALCKALAQSVYGSEDAMVRIDMSEYMEKFSVSRLIGAPPGYVGHEAGGELSERVRRRPYCLVLLDELEKAHRDICGLLLQIMEDGVLTDAAGRRVDFRNTLLVMTSNLGSGTAGPLGFGAQRRESQSMAALRAHFPPEFLGRLDCIAAFSPLTEGALTTIALQQLHALQQRAERQHLSLHVSREIAASLAQRAMGHGSGARELRRLIQTELEAPLAAELLSERPPARRTARLEEERIVLV